MEGIVNFVPNMASLLVMSGSWIWYVVGAYGPPHNATGIHCIEQALEAAPKGMEVIILGDINVRLRELRDNRDGELTYALVGRGLGDVTAQFMQRL